MVAIPFSDFCVSSAANFVGFSLCNSLESREMESPTIVHLQSAEGDRGGGSQSSAPFRQILSPFPEVSLNRSVEDNEDDIASTYCPNFFLSPRTSFHLTFGSLFLSLFLFPHFLPINCLRLMRTLLLTFRKKRTRRPFMCEFTRDRLVRRRPRKAEKRPDLAGPQQKRHCLTRVEGQTNNWR